MCCRSRYICGRPADTVRRTTCDTGDFVAFQTVHQSRLPIDCGCTVALLSVVIVTPGIHLHKSDSIFIDCDCYRSQRSCGKVMFSQACVKDSVHRGGVYPSMHWASPPGQTPPWADTAPPPDGHCSRQYASYWNALLLLAATKLWPR